MGLGLSLYFEVACFQNVILENYIAAGLKQNNKTYN